MFAEIVHYDVHVFVLLICHIISKEGLIECLALRVGVMRCQSTFPTERRRQGDEKPAQERTLSILFHIIQKSVHTALRIESSNPSFQLPTHRRERSAETIVQQGLHSRR